MPWWLHTRPKLLKPLTKTTNKPIMTKIGLFGGTFDPIHLGHARMAKAFCAQCGLDELVLLPAGDAYHKDSLDQASAAARLAMTELAVAQWPNTRVSDIDVVRQGHTYTEDTLRAMRHDYGPNAEFWWLMGADAFARLHTWHHFDQLFDLTNFAVAPRDAATSLEIHPDIQACMAKKSANKLDSKPTQGTIRILDLSPMSVSSSEIRHKIAHQQRVNDVLDPDVWAYIQTHSLYLGSE